MAENKPLSAEQQLLKLIEESGGKEAEPGRPASVPGKPRRPGLTFGAMMSGLKGRFSFFKRTAKKKTATAKKRFTVNFAAVNSALAFLAVLLAFYVGSDAFLSWRRLKMTPKLNFQNEKTQTEAPPKEAGLKDSAYYMNDVMERDIFKGGAIVKEEKKKETATADANEATKNLSLVGISWSANPDVIIEDKASSRTFFVKRGQMVGENVKVEAVYKDHVILSYEGEEFELR
jgi:hypothetical protein